MSGPEILDRYLLGEPVSKPAVIETLLRDRSQLPAAAPFYRALERVGAQADDMAFVALRLVLSGIAPSDASVRRLRAVAGVARACATGDRAGLRKLLARDAEVLAVLPHPGDEPDLEGLGLAARDAYRRELES